MGVNVRENRKNKKNPQTNEKKPSPPQITITKMMIYVDISFENFYC